MTKMIALFALCAGTSAALAQVPYSTGNYTQDFDSLPNSGSNTVTWAWSNNSTIPGWYNFSGSSSSNTIRESTTTNSTAIHRVDAGTSTTGGLFSYGTLNATDRALGHIASGSFESVTLLVIQNTNAFDLVSFTLSYDGEQWRNANTSVNSLVFDFTVLNALPTGADVVASNVAGFTAVPALDFASPVIGGTATALDGNLPANRTAGINATVNVTVQPGQYLVMRWWDNNDPGNDHGLAIDNVSFSAVPTPGAAALVGLGLLAAGRRRRV
ncbi:MAG TPA: hypothetical protein VEB22_08590 [Phycisphaerales bacterium]|nr:hypothetical protein [Phycisphaerales bacterium]